MYMLNSIVNSIKNKFEMFKTHMETGLIFGICGPIYKLRFLCRTFLYGDFGRGRLITIKKPLNLTKMYFLR